MERNGDVDFWLTAYIAYEIVYTTHAFDIFEMQIRADISFDSVACLIYMCFVGSLVIRDAGAAVAAVRL